MSIGNDQRSHGLDNRHSSGHHIGVVSALGSQNTVLTGISGGRLLLGNGGRGLEGNVEVNVLSVGDSALDSAGKVGSGSEPARSHVLVEHVVVLGARHGGAGKARTKLETLGGGDGHHGMGQGGLELVETGLSEANGAVSNHAGDNTANRVVGVSVLLDNLDHLLTQSQIGTSHGAGGVDTFSGDALKGADPLLVGGGSVHGHIANLRNKGDNLNVVDGSQVLVGDGAGSHSANGLSGRRSASARRSLDAVLLLVGVVGMGGSRVVVHLRVVMGSLVLVLNQHSDGSTQSLAVLGSALNSNSVSLVSRSGESRLSGSSSGQLGLDIGLIEIHSGGDSIDNAADGLAVRLAVGGDLEKRAESAHFVCSVVC